MKQNRRKFLQSTGGLALTALAGKNLFSLVEENQNRKIASFGLQLYTLRDELPRDVKGVLEKVAAAGYKTVESYEGPKGMFWGLSNMECKKFLERLGMKMISSHCDIEKDFEKKVNDAAAIGMNYLICPWVGPQKTIDDFKKIADKFNQCGERCKKAGLRFAYHNHDYAFTMVEGQMPMEVMLENTDPTLVDFEMDIYWVVTAGEDPEKWLKKYPHRFRLCHIKDRKKGAPLSDKDASCDLGMGSIDFSKILKTASTYGMQYFIVEQERYDGTTPLLAIQADAAYMKKLKF
jgi:sugar phosphate isomerase/epimerase